MVTDTNTTGARPLGERVSSSGEQTSSGENNWRAASESVSASAADVGAQVQGKVSGLLHGQMNAGADYVHMVSDTAHSFADELESRAPELARYMHLVAERADQFAEDFRHRSPDELLNVATDYARRNPRVFFGGAIALGFVLSRFLKSESDKAHGYSSASSGKPIVPAASGVQGSASRRQQAREDTSREDFSNAR